MSTQQPSTTRAIFAVLFATALVGCFAVGCDKPTDTQESNATADENAATGGTTDESATDGGAMENEVAENEAPTNWFGGPINHDDPELETTAALIRAGGGAEDFDFATALVAMLGEETVNAEVAKLTEQYGADKVQAFIDGMTFAVNDAIKQTQAIDLELPAAPEDLTGAALARKLVEAGTTSDGTFWAGYMFDTLLSNPIHVKVMGSIDNAVGHEADGSTHTILNQAMYDVAQALEMEDVKLSPNH